LPYISYIDILLACHPRVIVLLIAAMSRDIGKEVIVSFLCTRHRHLALQPPLANHNGSLVPHVLGIELNEVTVRTSLSSLQIHQRRSAS
jgi:hypothetical protein